MLILLHFNVFLCVQMVTLEIIPHTAVFKHVQINNMVQQTPIFAKIVLQLVLCVPALFFVLHVRITLQWQLITCVIVIAIQPILITIYQFVIPVVQQELI